MNKEKPTLSVRARRDDKTNYDDLTTFSYIAHNEMLCGCRLNLLMITHD